MRPWITRALKLRSASSLLIALAGAVVLTTPAASAELTRPLEAAPGKATIVADPREFSALQAAVEGQGVALARSVIAAGDLRAGRLVRPLSGTRPAPDAYYLVYPTALPLSRAAAAFCHWVKDAAREFQMHQSEPDGRAVRFVQRD